MFKIDVLGPFTMFAENGDHVVFEARSAAAVMALLALAKGRPMSRDAVASALWPEHEEVSARTNLRKALHRVGKATGDDNPLVADGNLLRLDPERVTTDLVHAERLHRTYLLAAREDEGVQALAEEWALRRRTTLEGWDDEWVENYRVQASFAANDLGIELARTYEAMGNAEASLAIWHEILERVPHHAQALQNALRLELQLRGREKASELARSARLVFSQDVGIEMPLELRRTIRDFQSGGLEPVPPPDYLRKRSELYMLARMFESNLTENRSEALALLARECTISKALAHPKAMLSLLTLALDMTEGTSEERLKVAALAGTVASWSSQFEIGHRWSDFVLESIETGHPLYGPVLGMKGFMLFEQRDYRGAEKVLDGAIEVLRDSGRLDDAARAGIGRAGVHWHLQQYEPAIALYEAAVARGTGRSDEIGTLMFGSANSNLCFVYSALGRWADAIPHGRTALQLADAHPVFGFVVPGTLGLALYAHNRQNEGLRLLAKALSSTIREGMMRFNQVTMDHAAIAIAIGGSARVAHCLVHANGQHRAALRHRRSPAEQHLIHSVAGFNPDEPPAGSNPLDGQSAATLSEWACEELERMMQREAAALDAVAF